ncbi:unnamed protein product [Acanthoscelides obtectus]|uniref:Uncharacterized protein n=1 Tax=Acanthoscelides obtectus TaxID=200917 RepID=A0A9P0LIJ9_ACAOB|nr:unnamed protein product [Acanthoscelides obtectus]CAK1676590.1 hypothetical protein AOBTE_LOCUS30837 [Acanthoscelides obtectus]
MKIPLRVIVLAVLTLAVLLMTGPTAVGAGDAPAPAAAAAPGAGAAPGAAAAPGAGAAPEPPAVSPPGTTTKSGVKGLKQMSWFQLVTLMAVASFALSITGFESATAPRFVRSHHQPVFQRLNRRGTSELSLTENELVEKEKPIPSEKTITTNTPGVVSVRKTQ